MHATTPHIVLARQDVSLQLPEVDGWGQADPYRACTLCDHGPRASGGARLCAMPAQPVGSVYTQRAPAGVCGPDALYMRLGGWDFS